MATSDIIVAVRQRFDVQVAQPNSLTVVYDNGPDPPVETNLWARFTVETDRPEPVSTAPVRWRIRGRGLASIHIPQQQGDGPLLDLFAAIEAAFTAVSLPVPKLQFQRPALLGPSQMYGGWFRRTARIEFYADEVGIE